MTAADASKSTVTTTLGGIEVPNGAASVFTLAVPTNITAGTAFSAKLSVFDAYGNKVKNYTGTVHFANTAGVLGLPADYTFNAADAGVHSFHVTLNSTTAQTLSVTDIANPLLDRQGHHHPEGRRRPAVAVVVVVVAAAVVRAEEAAKQPDRSHTALRRVVLDGHGPAGSPELAGLCFSSAARRNGQRDPGYHESALHRLMGTLNRGRFSVVLRRESAEEDRRRAG